MRGAAAGRPLYGIDAGGSGTTVRAWNGDRWTAPPLNPSSVGRDRAGRHLSELFARLRVHAEGARAPGGEGSSAGAGPALWLASASVGGATAKQEAARCAVAAREAGLRADLVISNDVTPLLLSFPPGAGHVITVCGTGSAFLATDGWSAPARIGGCEYLGSDEGSAFDLGLRGLRAAVRGLDGRAPHSALSDLLAAHAGAPVTELARRLARLPFPKAPVATLAPVVLRAWLDGDRVAAGLVGEVIGELLLGVRAARDAAALSPGWHLSVLGGVMTGCPEFFALLAKDTAALGSGPVRLVGDPASLVLEALEALSRAGYRFSSDPRIDSGVWHTELSAPRTELPCGKADQWTSSNATSNSVASTITL